MSTLFLLSKKVSDVVHWLRHAEPSVVEKIHNALNPAHYAAGAFLSPSEVGHLATLSPVPEVSVLSVHTSEEKVAELVGATLSRDEEEPSSDSKAPTAALPGEDNQEFTGEIIPHEDQAVS